MPRTPEELPAVLATIARAAVGAQMALDDAARDSLARWEEDGIPPSGTACSELRLTCGVSLRPHARRGRLRVAAGPDAQVSLALRRYPLDQGDDR